MKPGEVELGMAGTAEANQGNAIERMNNGVWEFDSVKVISAMRIIFGAAFLFDGLMKWYLIATGQMQGVVDGMYYTPAWLTANWLAFGVITGLGETFGGLFLVLGIFQRPAAAWSFLVMFSIWVFGGFGGFPNAIGATWDTAGYTDLGGDIMFGLVFLFLVFAPTAYGLSSYLRLPERIAAGDSLREKVTRALVC